MPEILFLVEEAPEGGFTAKAPVERIFTEGDDLESLRANVREATECHFADEDSAEPRIIRLHFVREELLVR